MTEDKTNRWIESVRRFYDLALEHGRGGFDQGRQACHPLFANALYLDEDQGIVPYREVDGEVYCNVAIQGSLFRGLVSLTRLTGDDSYRGAAKDSVRFFLEHYQIPQTGLLVWGGHVAIRLGCGLPGLMGYISESWAHHELKAHQPWFELMGEVAPEATERFIRGFWKEHVREAEGDFEFSRHGDMLGILSPEAKQRLLAGGGRCQFMTTATDLARGAVYLYRTTGDRSWLEKAQRMIRKFDDTRDPNTGLGQTSWSLENQPRILERHCLARYSKCAAACLTLAGSLGEEGEVIAQTAVNDLLAFGRHCYDEANRGYYIRRDMSDGSRVDPIGRDPLATTAYNVSGLAETKNASLPSLFYSFALGYRATGNDELMASIDRQLELMDVENGFDFAIQGSEAAAYLIQGLVELHQATKERRWTDLADKVAETSLERLVKGDGYLVDWEDTRVCRLGQRLPLALLRLAASEMDREGEVERDPGGGQYIDVDQRIRFRLNRHAYRIGSDRLDCVVGDRYPDGNASDGNWDMAGLHSVVHRETGADLLAPSHGGMALDIIRDFFRCSSLLSRTAVLFETGVELPVSGGGEIPCMVRAVYMLAGRSAVDLHCMVTPLQGEGAMRLTIGCESTFAEGSEIGRVGDGPAFTIRQDGITALLCAQGDCAADQSGENAVSTVRFAWSPTAQVGEACVLRVRLELIEDGQDPAERFRQFEQEAGPDVEEMIRCALAADQDVTTT